MGDGCAGLSGGGLPGAATGGVAGTSGVDIGGGEISLRLAQPAATAPQTKTTSVKRGKLIRVSSCVLIYRQQTPFGSIPIAPIDGLTRGIWPTAL